MKRKIFSYFKSRIKQITVWLVLILLIAVRYHLSRPIYQVGDRVYLNAQVTSEPTVYDFSQLIKLQGLLFYLPKYPEIVYGDEVEIKGKVILKNGKYWLENPELIGLKAKQGVLASFRSRIISFYQKSLPEPHSALVAGLTLGSKSGMPLDFWEKLKKTGTAHVVVASGTNVTLVAGFVTSFLIVFFRRKVAVGIALSLIWLYALMVGFDAPIIRAAMMGSLLIISQIFGRVVSGVRILLISGMLMLFIKPDWLQDLGFWLSFVATLSLMVFEKSLSRAFNKVPAFFREGLTTSLAAQIGVAPILYYVFGYIFILSPIVNMLVLWTVSYISLLGSLAGLVGVLYQPLGRGILYLSFPFTSWFIWVIELFS